MTYKALIGWLSLFAVGIMMIVLSATRTADPQYAMVFFLGFALAGFAVFVLSDTLGGFVADVLKRYFKGKGHR